MAGAGWGPNKRDAKASEKNPLVSYTWLEIGAPDDLERLAKEIASDYGAVVSLLRRTLNGRVKKVLIEQPYNDKDYRSTFYAFYSKRARPFQSDCVRLHFFGESVEFDESTLHLLLPSAPQGHYFGFMVLRPTLRQTIVRAVLDPNAINHGETLFILCAPHKVHLLGHSLTVLGFPFAQQASDIAVCAQTACWGVLRHYSQRWSSYREYLLQEVTTLGLAGGAGGIRSSRGLSFQEMERILVEAGTYPLRVRQDLGDRGCFQRELFAWLESGFPVVAMLDRQVHAISLIGLTGSALQSSPAPGQLARWSHVSGVVAMDDGRTPYWVAPLDKVLAPAWPRGFALDDVNSVVVPLPEKLTYPCAAVDDLAADFAASPPEHFEELLSKGCAVRYFVTTASALRRFALENQSALPPELYALYMRTELPQFVWIVELSGPQTAPQNHVDYRLVVDATAARYEEFPVFFAHSATRALVVRHDDNRRLEWIDFATPSQALGRMAGDLKTFGP